MVKELKPEMYDGFKIRFLSEKYNDGSIYMSAYILINNKWRKIEDGENKQNIFELVKERIDNFNLFSGSYKRLKKDRKFLEYS